ncbi:MAG: sugar transferase [candidate division Zixibacteria bacterium]|nr:sugar transferase [candidate division Zixibacteria bacterium]
MKLINRHKLEILAYRAMRAMLLVGVLALFGDWLNIFTSPEEAESLGLIALALQLALLIRLPSNDIMPLRNRSIDKKQFYSDEFRFALFVIAAAFFMTLPLQNLLFGVAVAANFLMQGLLFMIWRKYILSSRRARNGASMSSETKNVIIVGASRRGLRAADMLLKHPELSIRILGFVDHKRKGLWRYRDIPLLGRLQNIHEIIARNGVDFVLMAVEPEDFALSQRVFDVVEKMGIKLCLLPDIYDHTISRCRTSSLNGNPVLLYHSVPDDRAALFFKGTMDRLGALVGILLTWPILLIAAVAIKIDSHGPVIYRQKRSGRNGKLFNMLKLRTMTNGADKEKEKLAHLNEMSGPVFKIKNDPRVTKVGKILRMYSIDELPQLFNVLKGDMSLVGPRPPLPQEVEHYAPWQHRRLSVKPGVTCLWQINGRNKVDFNEWMKLDLQYIDRWSLKEDARILAKTFPAVVKGDGAS